MEKDIVVLSVSEYNKLRDFKNNVEQSYRESKFTVIETRIGCFSNEYKRIHYLTESEAIADIEQRYKELYSKNKELYSKNEELDSKNKELDSKNKELENIKNMSIFQFFKLRKVNK